MYGGSAQSARVFVRQVAIGGGGGGRPAQRLLLALRLGLLIVLGVVVLVPLVAIGVTLLVVAVVVGGAAMLAARVRRALAGGLKGLRRSDDDGRENVRVIGRESTGE